MGLEGAQALARALPGSLVTSLDVSANNLGVASVKALCAAVEQSPQIMALDITRNTGRSVELLLVDHILAVRRRRLV